MEYKSNPNEVEELKSCPFCGSRAEVSGLDKISCSNEYCGGYSWYMSEEKWNTRVFPPLSDNEVKELAELLFRSNSKPTTYMELAKLVINLGYKKSSPPSKEEIHLCSELSHIWSEPRENGTHYCVYCLYEKEGIKQGNCKYSHLAASYCNKCGWINPAYSKTELDKFFINGLFLNKAEHRSGIQGEGDYFIIKKRDWNEILEKIINIGE